jgi:hypothetical protein
MFGQHRPKTVLLAVCTIALLASAASVAQEFSDRDTREVGSYVLTESGLAKYTQATRNLGALAKKMSGNCDDDDGAESLDDSVARFEAILGVGAAMKSAGMTSHEYVVFAWSLSQPDGKLPAGTSMANVNFYRAHEVAIQKLGEQTSSDDCEDDDRDSEEQEQS